MKRKISILSAVLFFVLSPSMVFAGEAQAPSSTDVKKSESDSQQGKNVIPPVSPEKQKEIRAKVGALQIPFIKNEARVQNDKVKYYANTLAGTVFVEDGGIVYAFPGAGDKKKSCVIKERFVKGKDTKATGLTAAKTRLSRFEGRDKASWKSNVPTYDMIGFGQVYDNVEVTLKAYNNNIEKVFTVQQGNTPKAIAVQVEGVRNLKVGKAGDLELRTGAGTLKMTKPVAYQEIEGRRVDVQVAYNLIDKETYGFKVGDYNRSYPLVIDPLLASTYLGDISLDIINSMALSTTGSVYVAGCTNSIYFPTTDLAYNVIETGYQDVFVSRLSSDMTELEVSTLLGGSSDDCAVGVTLDSTGNVYVAGTTKSTNFPITSGVVSLRNSGNYDVFVSEFDPDLGVLMASTFIGGLAADYGKAIALDGSDNVYVGGYTMSSDFPVSTANGFDLYNNGMGDAFVVKLDPTLHLLLSSTFLGGISFDCVYALSYDNASDKVFVTGVTQSKDFPTAPGALRRSLAGSKDVFVARFDNTLSKLESSTFVGGTLDDIAYAIALDGTGDVYIAGTTKSPNFPVTTRAFRRKLGGADDAFVTKLDADLTAISASTFLGGVFSDYAFALALDASGDVYVAGSTKSNGTLAPFPTTAGAFGTTLTGGEDVFISEFTADLSTLTASTLIGGTADDRAYAMVLDSASNVYVAGYTKSANYPTQGTSGGTPPFDDVFGGFTKEDGFISILTGDLAQ